MRSVPILLAIALAASGGLAMLSFWAYYADPVVGESLSYFALFGSVALLAWALYGGRLDSSLLRQLATPLVLWVLGSAFLVFLGFFHGGESESIGLATTRFSGQLPSDNAIPYFFAGWFFENGHHGDVPEFTDQWLSSDRPPLQIGYVMLQRPFGWGNPELHYQVLGVVLQQLWIVGLWALLVAARVGRVTRALAMVTVLVSGLAIVNGFYVWPKLLPAAMLLAAAALVVTPLWESVRRSLWGAGLVAALLGVAMMGHGSSVFGVLPLVLIAAFRGLPSWRWLATAILVGIAVVVPWSTYQSYGDPPGNRLTKWMLAGVTEIDDRGTWETIRDSYGEAGLGGAIHNKAENFVVIAGGGPVWEVVKDSVEATASGDLQLGMEGVRFISFLYLLPSMGLLLLAPFAMAVARLRGPPGGAEWRFALTCLAIFAIGALGLGLVLFGDEPSRAAIHVGSYLIPIAGICGAVAGLRASFPRFALYYVGAWATLSLALYVPAFDPGRGSSYSVLAGLVAAASLAGFGLLALREEETGDVDQTTAARQAEKPSMAATAATSETVKTGLTSM